jgi:protein-tyrosine phosphatase
MKKILFVCYGNICRSPSAQGIFEHLARQKNVAHLFMVDSAGTHDFHIGRKPDSRSIKAAQKHNIDLSTQRARQFNISDFKKFDIIFVMDQKNKLFLTENWPEQDHDEIKEFIKCDQKSKLDKVPDPFYGSEKDFDEMMTLLFHLCDLSLHTLLQQN